MARSGHAGLLGCGGSGAPSSASLPRATAGSICARSGHVLQLALLAADRASPRAGTPYGSASTGRIRISSMAMRSAAGLGVCTESLDTAMRRAATMPAAMAQCAS